MATPTFSVVTREFAPVADNLHRRWQRWIGSLTLAVASLIGLLAFAAPFWAPVLSNAGSVEGQGVRADSLFITLLLSAACLVVLFANLGPSLSSKSVALLGVLLGINIVLRLVDIAFLLPGEFSPIFLLITLVGYIFGAQMGFLMGALTMLGSALLSGGIGPWLPFQMFTAGWIGLTAAWLRAGQHELTRLAIFSFGWGLLYGAIINLYSWPFLGGDPAMSWAAGTSPGNGVTRYATYYLITSLGPDLLRAVGNAVLILALAGPLLKVFRRFRTRFEYALVRAEG